ncbi:DUF2461 domain-containing protein [Streptacidiphilus fuscans]|uniref:DUF2461 domain-containing protein n=1 Tax=Streptacidiphilus fuscans TaxID=2789292 RepID=A0A931B292_9ACTN|nr:DUF2461 domain-containing protein [Streptacidiphilus fuscans]MBF9067362.1 DUF2461 domain-containing protein [Streptacidiphilus fuscans]
MSFQGWPAEALEFFEGLEADNSKTYWTSHKDAYERCVREPLEQLLEELAPAYGEGKIFRPYRDVRFSPDKSPYKTHIGAILEGGGYVQLSAEGLGAGSGRYVMSPGQLARYREAVSDERRGATLEAVLAKLTRGGEIALMSHDRLKSAPRGYPKDHPRIELLRNKSLAAWRQWPVEPWLGTAEAKKRVVQFLKATRPLNEWLEANVGGEPD